MFKGSQIAIWINVMQVLLTLIMLQQVYMFIFDHNAVISSGITSSGIPDLNLFYEFAARTAVMAIISILVIITQNPQHFLLVLFMNVLREGFETIIDPLYPLANAPMSPTGDFIAHVVIVAIEIFALITLYRITRKNA